MALLHRRIFSGFPHFQAGSRDFDLVIVKQSGALIKVILINQQDWRRYMFASFPKSNTDSCCALGKTVCAFIPHQTPHSSTSIATSALITQCYFVMNKYHLVNLSNLLITYSVRVTWLLIINSTSQLSLSLWLESWNSSSQHFSLLVTKTQIWQNILTCHKQV